MEVGGCWEPCTLPMFINPNVNKMKTLDVIGRNILMKMFCLKWQTVMNHALVLLRLTAEMRDWQSLVVSCARTNISPPTKLMKVPTRTRQNIVAPFICG